MLSIKIFFSTQMNRTKEITIQILLVQCDKKSETLGVFQKKFAQIFFLVVERLERKTTENFCSICPREVAIFGIRFEKQLARRFSLGNLNEKTYNCQKNWQTSKKVNVLWNFFKNLQQIFLGTRRFLFPDEKRKFFRSVFRKSDISLNYFWKQWPNCSPGYLERRYDNTSNDCFAHSKKRLLCFFQ